MYIDKTMLFRQNLQTPSPNVGADFLMREFETTCRDQMCKQISIRVTTLFVFSLNHYCFCAPYQMKYGLQGMCLIRAYILSDLFPRLKIIIDKNTGINIETHAAFAKSVTKKNKQTKCILIKYKLIPYHSTKHLRKCTSSNHMSKTTQVIRFCKTQNLAVFFGCEK